MVEAVKQRVTVQPGGLVEVRAPELAERLGEEAEVIVLLNGRAGEHQLRTSSGRWRRFAGSVQSGDPHSADNDRIDADLAREYGATHEPGPAPPPASPPDSQPER
jgi:hypothetical protein